MNDRRGGYHFRPTEELRDALTERQELRKHARDFLLAGGLMAGHADGELSAEEQEYLIGALAELYDDPASEIARLDSPTEALELLQASMEWLAEHGGARRLELYKHLAGIVAADGVLDQNEVRYMQNIAVGLGIALDLARDLVLREFTDPGKSE